MGRTGRTSQGLLWAVLIFGVAGAAGVAPARAESPATSEASAEAVGQVSNSGQPAASMSSATSSDAGASARTVATDRPPRDPSRYPRLDVPTKPWAYDTSYFFALTRGLEGEQLATWCRRASLVGTVPIDVFGLPAAALSGLFGS